MILSRKSNKNYQDSLLRGQETRNRLKCSGAEKQVLQYTLDGMFLYEWKSMTEAERQLGISRCGIAKCCNGIFKQFKGYKWIWKTQQKNLSLGEEYQQRNKVIRD